MRSAIYAGILWLALMPQVHGEEAVFEGKYFRGRGDVEYLKLLDTARRMFAPDPQYQNLSMLYCTNWNGFVEGPTWDAWWIQNSYGTTYAELPFLEEPFLTFLQNAQDLWFDNMGDGKRTGTPSPPFNWVAPDGCLCDCARKGWIVYRQGDGRTDIHDWAMEFTAAGILLQSELLLINHDPDGTAKYLSRLERSANFIETRRDTNNLFLAGPAGNLLAPSYAGWKKPDGTYGKAWLTGLSITYIAALDRLIELEKLSGRADKAKFYTERRDTARKALPLLMTGEGYFIRSLDPDGVKHGVFGAPQHGYLEASPNHDAVAFRVVDDAQAEKIYHKMESIPELRPHDFILPNYPSYDDMYEKPEGLWGYGTWVNGGHWSTCEARMVLGYYRLGQFAEAGKSMRQLLHFADQFRMDNPLTDRGNAVYQPSEPINLCYDSFGPAAAMVRGLFEYLYHENELVLIPHIPPGITELEQDFPIRFGNKTIYLATAGTGLITDVRVNGHRWKAHDKKTVILSYDKLPEQSRIEIYFGHAKERIFFVPSPLTSNAVADSSGHAKKLQRFERQMVEAGMGSTYEAAHARLALEAIRAAAERKVALEAGKIKLLPAVSQKAADQSYLDAATKLYDGLALTLQSYAGSNRADRREMLKFWQQE